MEMEMKNKKEKFTMYTEKKMAYARESEYGDEQRQAKQIDNH